MQEKIKTALQTSIDVKKQIIQTLIPQIESAAMAWVTALKNGHKIMFCGNGGSAADAQHLAGELIGRFLINRKSLPGLALTTDSSILTCLGNDFGFETIFARQVEGLAQKGDVLVGISTSGNSPNIQLALEKAKAMGGYTMAFLGGDGGSIAKVADLSIIVPSKETPRVQESHITIGHIICGLAEEEIFKK